MKKSIYIIGIISLALLVVATIFKVTHLAGANILLLIGLGTITLFFLPVGYIRLLKTTNDKLLRFVYSAAFISFIIDFIGMAFKILHWPGAGIMLIIGVPIPFILFLPAYVRYHNKRKLKTDLHFFAIVLFMVYLGVFSSLLAIDVSRDVLGAYAHTANNISATNQYIAENVKNKPNAEVLFNQLEKIKQDLVSMGNARSGQAIISDGHIDYIGIERKSMRVPYRELTNIGLESFNKQFDNYCQNIQMTEINRRLVTEINTYRLGKNGTTPPIIGQLPLTGVLDILTDWQNKILLIELLKMQKTEPENKLTHTISDKNHSL